jgi:dTDP-4-amino-4,6-dideoxygalactose transaminase
LVTDFTAFKGMSAEGLQRSSSFSSRAVTLPLSPAMRTEDVDVVCDALLSSGG